MKGLVQQNTQECVQSLVAWVTDMKLTKLTGENIHTATSMIRGVVNSLESVAATPSDMTENITKTIMTSLVPKFNIVFLFLETP